MSDLAAPEGRRSDLRYVQVADDIETRIVKGELKPAQRLISEHDLATYYECSYGTIRRAMKELRIRGLIATIHGRGTFVTYNPDEPPVDPPPDRGDTETER